MIPWVVYALRDPRSLQVRYVGCARDVAERLKTHVYNSTREETRKARWIRELSAEGLRPIPEPLESGSGDDSWGDRERHWIAHFRATGHDILNATDGGPGAPGFIPSDETRAKMSSSHTGRKQSPEAIEKAAAAHRGRKYSEEHRARQSASRKGLKRKPSAVAATAEALRGRKQSPEHIAKRVAATVAAKRAKADQAKPKET
jgi:hypothetical protein